MSQYEQPLTVQHPDDHEPTIPELMASVANTIKDKDATIAKQREQLMEVRDLLKGVLNVSTSRTNTIENVQRSTNAIGTPTHE